MLKISNLKAKREDKLILNGINLNIEKGEKHVIMGPNGSGKSTLAAALMGHPDIEVVKGSKVTLDDKDLLKMDVSERAKSGLFLAFQYPVEIPGVPLIEFLRLAYNQKNKFQNKDFVEVSPYKFKKVIEEKMANLKMDTSFLTRNLNEGFSGGEKKKAEILQMAVLEPKYAVLDETDSGLDVTALKIVAEGASKIADQSKTGMLIITHYSRILRYIKPDHVHVLVNGRIVKSAGPELAEELDEKGYENFI